MFKLLFIFYVYLMTFTISLLSKKEFGKCLPNSFISIILFLFIGGLLNDLRYGFIISIIFIVISLLIKFKELKTYNYSKLFFTPAFFIYSILFIVVIIYHKNTTLSNFDEFSHWGVMTKEMFRLNKFYCVNESNLMVHKSYTPFFSLIEYLYCKFNRSFYEPYLYQSLSLFILSFFMVLFDNKKSILKFIFSIFLILALHFMSFLELSYLKAINSIYADVPLAIISAYTIYQAYTYVKEKDTSNLIFLSLALSATLLTKQFGIIFIALAFLVYVLRNYFENNKILETKVLIPFLSPFIFYGLYKIYLKQFNFFNKFKFNFKDALISFINIVLFQKGETYQIQTFHKFLNALFNEKIIANIPISYFVFVILLVIVLAIVLYIAKKNIKDCIIYSCIFLFGSLIYTTCMLFTYVIAFDPIEASALMCFPRYMNTYLLFGMTLIIFILIKYDSFDKGYIITSAFVTLFFIFVGIPNKDYLLPKQELHYEIENYENANAAIDKIKSCHSGNVLLIQSNVYEAQSLGTLLNYYLDDYKITSIVNNRISDFTAILEDELSLNDFKELLNEYDYIYIDNYDDYFYDNFWSKISDVSLENNRLYFSNKGDISWGG